MTRMRRARRAGTVVALAVAAALVLTGCVSWFLPPSTTATSTPTSEKVSSELRPYYKQSLVWKQCYSTFQCTTAVVPLDWSDPGGSRIHLALIRHRATGTSHGSLLFNPGGPGASGYDFLHTGLSSAVDSTLEKNFDVIGFDPRGVNKSTAVTCTTSDSQLDSFIYDVLPGRQGSAQWLAAARQQYTAFGDRCKQLTGALLGHVDTISAAKDLDVLRAALGDAKLNYLGYSYGTLLGATYAGLFPTKVGRLVLDGALDPTTTGPEVALVQAEGFENALRAYLTDCLTRSACPFRGETVDQALARIRSIFSSLAATPLRNSDGRELGTSTFLTALIYPLYSKGNWTYIDKLIEDVDGGSARIAFILADAYNDRNQNGTYADNSTQAFIAINCLDYPSDDSPEALAAQAAALTKAAPTLGPYMAYDVSCASWPYSAVRTPAPITAAGAPPIVVVGTTGDPATPYRWAQGLASQLDRGVLVTYDGQGHTGYNKGDSCVNAAVDDYFVDGTVPKSGLVCR